MLCFFLGAFLWTALVLYMKFWYVLTLIAEEHVHGSISPLLMFLSKKG